MRRWLLVSIAAVVLAAAGCSGAGYADTCALIDGKAFASSDQMECGLGPSGVTYCNWSVTFTGGAYSWSHSDVVETGRYTCDGAAITATRSTTTTPLLGRLDPQTGQLTWDGATYLVQ